MTTTAANRVLRALLFGMTLARSADTLRRAIRVALARLALVSLALLALVAGLGFLIAAAYAATALWIGPIYASLATGAALLLVAWVWLALSRRVGRS
jgi:hypothetical protein